MNNNKKGQLSLVNIFGFIILVFVAIIASGIITPFVASQIGVQNLTGADKLIAQSFTTILLLGVIITFFLYITPVRAQQY